MIRLENIHLYTGEAAFENGCVVVDGDRILYAGEWDGCPAGRYDSIDGRGGIVMPGLYNAHCHAAMTLERGVGSDLHLMDWLNQVFPIEANLKERDVYDGTKLAILEMIRRGVVSFADMYYFMDEVARAVEETGIRANLCRGCSDLQGVDSISALKDAWDGKANGRIRISMGLHAEYTSTMDVAQYAAQKAREWGLSAHIHLAETRSETMGCMERHGCTPAEYFRRVGMFDVPTICAHCVYMTDEDMGILASHGASAIHNPTSNLKLASGIAKVTHLMEKGVNVALGTDGPSSNNVLDLMAEMKLASILQKGALEDPTALNAHDALKMATLNGAKAMGFADCGVLAPGKKADLILVNDETLAICPDIPAELVYCAQGLDVTLTMVDGRILYRDGEFMTLDPKETVARAMEAYRSLMRA